MRIRCGGTALCAVLCLVLFLSLACDADAHPGQFGTAIHTHTIKDALALATWEHKLVLVHVREAQGKRFSVFRWHTPQHAQLLDLLVRETVIVELDAAQDAAQLTAYHVAAPAVLLLNAEGGLLGSARADLPIAQLSAALTPLLTGSAAVERAQAALQELGPDHAFTHERLAAALRGVGRNDEALAQYRWLVARVHSGDTAAVARTENIYKALIQFADKDAAAASLLQAEINTAESEVVAAPEDVTKAKRLAVALSAPAEAPRALRVFSKLEADSRARHVLLDPLLDKLVNAGRYKEVLQLIEPLGSLKGEIDLYKRMGVERPSWAENGTGRGTRAFVIQRSANLVEALAGSGDEAKAKEVIAGLLAFDASDATRQALEKAVSRSGRTNLLDAVRQ